MIVVHVQVVVGPKVPDRTDGVEDVFVTIPEAVCSSFDVAMRKFPVGKETTFQWGDFALRGVVWAVHEQLSLVTDA